VTIKSLGSLFQSIIGYMNAGSLLSLLESLLAKETLCMIAISIGKNVLIVALIAGMYKLIQIIKSKL